MIYKNTADLIYIRAIIFQATGNPAPEIIWFKGESPIKESSRVAVVNSNTKLGLSNIPNSDLEEYQNSECLITAILCWS